jgi:hypothetical protein
MSNSFYYFFSATPQVLAAILALFGVFVIFKVQILRTHMLGIGTSLSNYSAILSTSPITDIPLDDTYRDMLKVAVAISDVEGLRKHLNQIKNPHYLAFKHEFNKVYFSLLRLINSTICWSIVITSIILTCLIIIPFGCFLLKHFYLLYVLYGLVIVFSILCFYNLIRILRISLFDNL